MHHVGTHDGNPYVALEYLQGPPLRERLEEHRPALKEALRIGLAMAEALEEAHRCGVLHRDLKPPNVLLARDGRLRVLDFGLAKEATPAVGDTATEAVDLLSDTSPDGVQSSATGLRGSPPYMAPEPWKQRPCSAAVDIWALGLILHQLLSGHHVIAGFANGLLGMWNLSNGTRLDHARLDGPVTHLLRKGAKLHAASALGQQHI